MNGRMSKKINRHFKRSSREALQSFFTTIVKWNFAERFKVAWKIVFLNSFLMQLMFFVCIVLIVLIHANVFILWIVKIKTGFPG